MSSEDSKAARNTNTGAWIGAGATVLAAIIAAVIGVVAFRGGSGTSSGGGPPTARACLIDLDLGFGVGWDLWMRTG